MKSRKIGCLGLFRHGPAAERHQGLFPNDDLRPLTPEGRKRVKSCAKGLQALNWIPDRILVSPAVRTRETAEILVKTLGLPPRVLRVIAALHPEIDPRAVLKNLSWPKNGQNILWVGHEPWLGEALGAMLNTAPLPLRKGGFATLSITGGRPESARLTAFLPPEALVAAGKRTNAGKAFRP